MNIDHIQLSPNLHNSQQFLELIYILVNLIHPLSYPIQQFLINCQKKMKPKVIINASHNNGLYHH